MRRFEMEQIAVMNIHYLFYPLEHFFRTMAELGVKNIDLWAGYPHLLIEEGSPEAAEKVKHRARSLGMNIVCCTPEQVRYPINLASADRKVRERTIAYLLRGLETAARLEAGMFQVVPGWGFYDEPVSQAWVRMEDSLQTLCKRAEELGITILLEPLQKVESNLVNDRFQARKALDEVGSRALKIVVDTCHMAVNGEALEEYFELLGDGVGHIHLNESDQVPWGEGNLPFEKYVETLERYGYDRYATLEICSPWHHVDADRSVKDSVGYVRRMLKR